MSEVPLYRTALIDRIKLFGFPVETKRYTGYPGANRTE